MKRKVLPDSIAGSPEVGTLLTKLFATKKIKINTKPRTIYEDEKYEAIMGPVAWENSESILWRYTRTISERASR